MGRSLSEEKKDKILEMLARGHSQTEISKLFDMSLSTISHLKKNNIDEYERKCKELVTLATKDIKELFTEESTGLATKMVKVAHRILDSIGERDLSTVAFSQLGVTLGIVIDKMRLLTDQSTNNLNIAFTDRKSALAFINSNKEDKVIDV